MRIWIRPLGLTALLALLALLAFACGGPSAPLPTQRGKGGSGGTSVAEAGGSTSTVALGGTTALGGAPAGGMTSTYVEPTCPVAPTAQIEAECDAFDQTTCPAGEGCYPTITYPSTPCEPEIYRTLCLTAGTGEQGDDCLGLLDCAPGFICVVSGYGTQCQKACDSSSPRSCPAGLFCEAIDLPGIGTCY